VFQFAIIIYLSKGIKLTYSGMVIFVNNTTFDLILL